MPVYNKLVQRGIPFIFTKKQKKLDRRARIKYNFLIHYKNVTKEIKKKEIHNKNARNKGYERKEKK